MALKSNLKSLKDKLKDISTQLEEESSAKAIKITKDKSMDEKLSELNDKNREIINLNIGGQMFATSKSTLMKDPDTVFAILLRENSLLPNNELFFDRSPRLFNILLDYLRYGKINYKMIPKDDLVELYDEALFYEITDVRDYLCEKTKAVSAINMNFSGPYMYKGKVVGENNVYNLHDKEMKKGVCCNSPGWVEFELNTAWDIESFDIAGYHGDKKMWYPGNGCGAQVLVSENGKDYKKIDNIPSKFSKEIVNVKVKVENNPIKFVKFVHSSYLGIGYLDFNKLEE